jgi:hypothetical protein
MCWLYNKKGRRKEEETKRDAIYMRKLKKSKRL